MEQTPQSPRPQQSVSPLNPTPVDTGNKSGDLYAAITAEDEAPVVEQKKKKESPFMAMVVAFMRVTFWMDLTRRSNEGAFRVLALIWHTWMAILYVSGLLTLFLCLTSFVELPLKLENFFKEHNIQYDSLKMVDYSLSQINIVNLHDTQNLYQVPDIRVHSTFGDFLKNRILALDIDGLKMNLQTGQKNTLQWVSELFAHFNSDDEKSIQVNSLTVSNAVLTVLGKNLTIPVAFTITGDYTQKPQTSVNFNVNEDFLSLLGNMLISGNENNRHVDVTITSGLLNLPNSPEEEVEGKITADLSENEIQKLEAEFKLTYAYSVKNMTLTLTKGTSGYDGEFILVHKNVAGDAVSHEALVDMTVGFKNLSIDEKGHVTTKDPLSVNIRRLKQNNVLLSGFDGTFNGTLSCFFSEGKCSYQLSQESSLQLNELDLNLKEQKIALTDTRSLVIVPDGKENLVLQFQTPELQMNAQISQCETRGYLNTAANTLDASAKKMLLKGSFSQKQGNSNLSVNISGGNLTTTNMTLKQVAFSSDNIFDETSPVRFTAESVTTSSGLIKKPVQAEIVSVNGQSSIKLKIQDTGIALAGQGVFHPFKGSFSGNFALSKVQLEKLSAPLSDISDLFPAQLTNVSGELTASGRIQFTGENNVAGPLYLGLKDVSFDWNKTKIKGLNTVIALQSVVPFVTAPNQMFFIASLMQELTLSNLTSTFQVVNQDLRLFNIGADLGNQNLSLTSATISLTNPSALIYLKTKEDFMMNDFVPYLDLENIKITGGLGNLTVALDISDKGVGVSSTTLKVSEMPMISDVIPNPIFDLFRSNVEPYFVRTGKLILTGENHLQAEFDGWYLPQREKQGFSQKDILLNTVLFQKGAPHSVPGDIWNRINLLFGQGNGK